MKTDNTVNITVENGDKKLQLSINKYADLNDWITVFKTILIHQTFHEDLVKELFDEPEFANDVSDEEHVNYFCDVCGASGAMPTTYTKRDSQLTDVAERGFLSMAAYGKYLDCKLGMEKGISPDDIREFDRIRKLLNIDLQCSYEETGSLMDKISRQDTNVITWESCENAREKWIQSV